MKAPVSRLPRMKMKKSAQALGWTTCESPMTPKRTMARISTDLSIRPSLRLLWRRSFSIHVALSATFPARCWAASRKCRKLNRATVDTESKISLGRERDNRLALHGATITQSGCGRIAPISPVLAQPPRAFGSVSERAKAAQPICMRSNQSGVPQKWASLCPNHLSPRAPSSVPARSRSPL